MSPIFYPALAYIQARTPLHEAATRNHAAVVELLLEHGASANAQDRVRAQPKARTLPPHAPLAIPRLASHTTARRGMPTLGIHLAGFGLTQCALVQDLQTPLICAAKAGEVEAAYEMVDEGLLSCCVAVSMNNRPCAAGTLRAACTRIPSINVHHKHAACESSDAAPPPPV